ncbi:MAG: 5-methyltetrahydropteroyltriglutamate--homocysteine S-methyltransferase [Alphaproteobacteria bacterium]
MATRKKKPARKQTKAAKAKPAPKSRRKKPVAKKAAGKIAPAAKSPAKIAAAPSKADKPGERAKPPFRVDHVGSFLRPDYLLDAARKAKDGAISADEYRRIQDKAVTEIVRFQESIGLRAVTDGEFRRRLWSAGFFDAVPGFGLREEGSLKSLTFRSDTKQIEPIASPYAKQKLRRTKPIVVDDFKFLKKIVKKGVPKVTIPSPPVMHYFLGPKSVDEAVYPDIEEYFADLAKIYQQEISELAKEGCTFVQLDDTALPCNCDEHVRDDVRARGEDPDKLTARYAKLINESIKTRPKSMGIGIHLCRGNLKGMWMAEGGYEPVADKLFNEVGVDAYFLEYDSERAGDFKPLRHVPKGKTIVLGLISTKTPKLESKKELLRRIDDAAKYVPLDQLCVSPQCGFSSGGGGGQVVTQDDQKRKIGLLHEVAKTVWG